MEQLEKELSSPLLNNQTVDGQHSGPISAFKHATVTMETQLPRRPVSIDGMAARYGHNERSKRYSRGKKFSVNDESAIDLVPPDDTTEEDNVIKFPSR
jgi:hypothetical protein